VVTDYVLRELEKHSFQATFFCIGDKVGQFLDIYRSLKEKGHAVGNHTHNHLNAWKTENDTYLKNVMQCKKVVTSKLFRPPYGRVTYNLTKELKEQGYKIVMWDVLSGDFDLNRSAASCLDNLKKNTKNGSVIVFHDSDKSFEKLQEILPAYLQYLATEGWKSESIV
jgi:peptidoglycan/xylan/chitin deacetylase (PgdA/CDA1 family)